MSTTTTNLELTKPAVGEKVDVAVLNDNMDKLDAGVVATDNYATAQTPYVSSGATISAGSSAGTFKVAALEAYLRTTDSSAGLLEKVTLAEQDDRAITAADTTYFVCLNYNGGSPTITLSTSDPYVADKRSIPIGKVRKDGSDNVYFITGGYNFSDGMHKIQANIGGFLGTKLTSGSVPSYSGTNNFVMTAGSAFRGVTNFALASYDSAVTQFTYVYSDGGTGYTTGLSNTLDYAHYDDGSGTLASVLPNKYSVFWVRRGASAGTVFVQYGEGSYSLAEAESASEPERAEWADDFGVLIGKIIMPVAGGSFTAVQMATDTVFSGAAVGTHNNLGGLNVGDYVHLTAAEYAEQTALVQNNNYEYEGRDLSTIFADAAALHTAIAAGNFQNIRVGDYWPETLAGTYRDYGLFTCPIGTTYYSDTALTTSVDVTAELLAATYVNETYCSISISSTTYYVAHDDCLEYYERTINALMKFEVGAINPYIRYGNTELTAPHIAFVPRDCIPQTLKFRKANAAWHPHYHTAAGDGTTVAFTLPETPASLVSVKVDGVAKSSPGDYSITGAVVTFTAAPANEAVIVVKYLWTDNPWLGSALYETLNNATYGLLPIIAATALGAYLFAGPNSLGMRWLGETKASGATNATSWGWRNRGKIFILAECEVWGKSVWSDTKYEAGLSVRFPIFAGTLRHIQKGLGNGGSRYSWWCGSSNAGSSASICFVYSGGYPNNGGAENTYLAVAPCFLIS